jgi:hypothetical protein
MFNKYVIFHLLLLCTVDLIETVMLGQESKELRKLTEEFGCCFKVVIINYIHKGYVPQNDHKMGCDKYVYVTF